MCINLLQCFVLFFLLKCIQSRISYCTYFVLYFKTYYVTSWFYLHGFVVFYCHWSLLLHFIWLVRNDEINMFNRSINLTAVGWKQRNWSRKLKDYIPFPIDQSSWHIWREIQRKLILFLAWPESIYKWPVIWDVPTFIWRHRNTECPLTARVSNNKKLVQNFYCHELKVSPPVDKISLIYSISSGVHTSVVILSLKITNGIFY